MRNLVLILSVVSAMCLAPAAAAAPVEVKASPGKEWKHKPTNLKLPAAINGLNRTAVTAYVSSETDIGANYWSADGSDNVTIFLFRNVSGNVPLWFDRARSVIQLLPEKYPNPKSSGVRAFTPRGQSVASGLMEVFTTDQKYKATGLMVLPVNGFYAKIRATSARLDAAALELLMLAAANSVEWSSRTKEVAASAISDCPAPLPARTAAKIATVTEQDRMTMALLGGVLAQAASFKEAPAQLDYCREPGPSQIAYGVYRPANSTERYLMALLDSGRAIAVGNSGFSQILSELDKPSRISVSHVEMERTATYGEFETLPLPEQVVEMIEKSSPVSVATTWGEKRRDITINTGP